MSEIENGCPIENLPNPIRHLVMFSGGASSWAAAKRVVEKEGTDEVVLLFADTRIEDEDLYRFLDDAEKNIGAKPIRIADGRTPWEVMRDVKMIGNSRIDPCSRILKRELLSQWRDTHCNRESTTVYVGLDWTEMHRVTRLKESYLPWRYEAPMTGAPYLTKEDVLEWMKSEKLNPPRLYKLGFPHNNCFSGETRFVTSEGIKPLAQCVGQTVEVLTKFGNYKPAIIQSFGMQRLFALTIERYGHKKTIYTTYEHRWICYATERSNQRVDKFTSALQPGDRLVPMFAQKMRGVRPSAFGIAQRLQGWRVISIESTERVEKVYCAVVPDTHCFTLEDNILTGNCGGACIKAGQAQWAHLLRVFPDRYKYHEAQEQEMREIVGDHSILRIRKKNEQRSISLKEFRISIQESHPYDALDWGGCGCAID